METIYFSNDNFKMLAKACKNIERIRKAMEEKNWGEKRQKKVLALLEDIASELWMSGPETRFRIEGDEAYAKLADDDSGDL